MRPVEDDADQMVGQDSFLDVVTNIVGILILLVMVVSLRASHSAERSAEQVARGSEHRQRAANEELARVFQTAVTAERDVRDSVRRALDTRQETKLREQERVLLQTMVTKAEQDVAARREKLTAEGQQDFDIRRQLSEAQDALDHLGREQAALASQDSSIEEIECRPTPLAKVVTGDETHILLSDDHIAVVPFQQLLDSMMKDARSNSWRIKDEDVVERTIGPIGGFRVQYEIKKSKLVARGANGNVVAGYIPDLVGCWFLPVQTPAGEPAGEALQPNSDFQQHLAQLNPQRTTVTIWTYPGNYEWLREVRRVVRELGFQIALRPLPAGVPIGASRSGTESVAE